MIAIQTANLTKKYGDIIAINGVDFEVEAGEIVGCLGPERSGKTTLLRLLTGLVRPTLGDSTVLGLSSMKESRKLRAKSGIVTDTAACIGSMSALENLLMFASMYGMRKEQARTHAAQLLKKLDLWNARDRKVYTFSTEMCRRLSLARALVHHPQIVFSDGLPAASKRYRTRWCCVHFRITQRKPAPRCCFAPIILKARRRSAQALRCWSTAFYGRAATFRCLRPLPN